MDDLIRALSEYIDKLNKIVEKSKKINKKHLSTL